MSAPYLKRFFVADSGMLRQKRYLRNYPFDRRVGQLGYF